MDSITDAAVREHGADPTEPGGLAWILSGEAGRSPLPAITTDREYTRAVRRILRRAGLDDLAATDGRLLAVGYDSVPPSRMARLLPAWLRFWGRAASRPEPVGSCYNVAPATAWRAFVRRLGPGGARSLDMAERIAQSGGRLTTSDATLRDAGRALGRSSARRRHHTLGPREGGSWALQRLSVSALAALGRLTPQLQAAAIERMMEDDPHPDGVVCRERWIHAERIGRGAIPWEHVAAERARGERYLAARYLRGRALCAALGVRVMSADDAARLGVETVRAQEWAADSAALVAVLAPGWTPGCGRRSVTTARRLAAGETVAAVAASLCEEDGLAVDVPLTRREAHAVVVGALCGRRGPRVILWMATGAASGTGHRVSSVAATRWLAAVASDPERIDALMRERTERVPLHLAPPGWHGEADGDHIIARWSYDARIDELRAADLPDGPRTGVERAMRLLAERTARERMRDTPEGKRQLASPPPWWQPVPGVRLLDSAHALWAEGEELAHCVAGYVGAVQACRSVIVGLQAQDGSRSTVELDRATKTVYQHRGWRNGVPSAACERLLGAMLVAWRGWS